MPRSVTSGQTTPTCVQPGSARGQRLVDSRRPLHAVDVRAAVDEQCVSRQVPAPVTTATRPFSVAIKRPFIGPHLSRARHRLVDEQCLDRDTYGAVCSANVADGIDLDPLFGDHPAAHGQRFEQRRRTVVADVELCCGTATARPGIRHTEGVVEKLVQSPA